MQTVTKIVAIAAASIAISFNVNAAPTKLTQAQEATLVKICKSATHKSPLRFIHTLRRNHLRTKTVAENVVCNGQEIAEFALNHGATKVANRLYRSMGVRGRVTIQDIAKLATKAEQGVTL